MGGHYATAARQPAIMTREHLEACRHLFGDVPEWVEQLADIRTVESATFASREVVGTGCSAIANKAEGKPEISPAPLLQLAEQLMPSLRSAEWRDKAEAALADLSELDLRDLRSVVVASDAGARDDETRALAEQLKTGLAQRVESEQAAWLTEISELLAGGRAVRALRVSSRPPKAGAPLPAELSAKLTEAAAASLTAETGQDRFATVLDALAFSPVRTQVVPAGIPAEPSTELLAAVKKVAARLPQIAALFGVEATAPSKSKPASKPRPPKPVIAETPASTDAPEADTTPVAAVDETAPIVEAAVAPEPAAAEEAPAVEEDVTPPQEPADATAEVPAGDDA